MALKKTKPDSVDTRFVYLLGRGYSTVEAGKVMGISDQALRSRTGRLYEITHTKTLCQLVYWMLSEDKFQYPKRFNRCPVAEHSLQIIQLLAEGEFREEVRQRMNISNSGYDKWMRVARGKVQARSVPHLMAICWTEDWIV